MPQARFRLFVGSLATLVIIATTACSSPNRAFDASVDVDRADRPGDAADVHDAVDARGDVAPDHAADAAEDIQLIEDTGFPQCPADELMCNGSCTVVQRDALNCGSCGHVCAGGQACIDGACACPPGQTLCGNRCVVLSSDAQNCGACGNACPANQFCNGSSCNCALGQEYCGGACVDTVSNPLNCGFCGVACAPGQTCFRGMCGCPLPTVTCGGINNRCIDLRTDPANCGGCGQACGAGQTCVAGACQCINGASACGTACVDTTSDARNCGACGNACPPNDYCVGGHCAITCTAPMVQCPVGAGFDCVDTTRDARNCGACGAACAAGEVCSSGHCACAPGSLSCGGRCVDATSDATNCGACGMTCGAGTSCVAGACTCRGGLLSCGGRCLDASHDNANCGACGNACPSLSYCDGSSCHCAAGFTMCNGRCVDLQADAANCGTCGTTCSGDTYCLAGRCSCLARGGSPGTTAHGFTSGHFARTYRVHIPPSYDPTRPSALVIGFHGFTSTGDTFMDNTGFNGVADARNFIVMYPDGILRSWNAGNCCGGAALEDVDDVRFARELVAHARLEFCVDPSRVYASGFSNGSMMSQRLGCEASDVFVGIGVHAGPLAISSCSPSQPVSVIYSHSIEDPVVDYTGSSILGTMSAPDTFAAWGRADACSGSPASVYAMGIAHCSEYQTCGRSTQVEFCSLDRDQHDWPLVTSFDTTEMFADFFLSHPRR